ncbi:HK97 gp10 family phage protein [Hazenella sp. IB182353]|uniref:HK97 gp10 family phage protein n=1 Tax=Polycladospora coralii TaxID=2771432 RepID=UPI0017468266|nr:HK97 gp10 family phage protein [Polycladospora coralii]MBS7531828.1 HK97 gp10 family phage protein [Polycladospora coralii]
MPATSTLNLIQEMARLTAKATQKASEYTATELWGNVRENSPTDHGRLAGSWQLRGSGTHKHLIYTNVTYARFQNDGTGIYGPKRREITPVRAKVLAFEWNGKMVFAKSVKGVQGKKYIEKSIDQTEDRRKEFVEMAFEDVGLL